MTGVAGSGKSTLINDVFLMHTQTRILRQPAIPEPQDIIRVPAALVQGWPMANLLDIRYPQAEGNRIGSWMHRVWPGATLAGPLDWARMTFRGAVHYTWHTSDSFLGSISSLLR